MVLVDLGGVYTGANDRNDGDAVGYSLHTSLCGWPGVITKLFLGKLGFLKRLACMIGS
jgi:hypothetical protein